VIDRARTSRARSISEATIRGLRPGDSSSTMDERAATVLAGTAPLFVLDVRARALTGARHTGAALRSFITSQAPESIEFVGGTPSTSDLRSVSSGLGTRGSGRPTIAEVGLSAPCVGSGAARKLIRCARTGATVVNHGTGLPREAEAIASHRRIASLE
jgi:hypothetical protein